LDFDRLKKHLFTLLTLFLLLRIPLSPADAVTRFGVGDQDKIMPAPFEPDDIWFYDSSMSRVTPDMGPNWITVVFRSDPKTGADIVNRRDDIAESFYDPDIAADACFFKLEHGLGDNALRDVIAEINQNECVAYTHPTFRMGDRTYTFFNAFEMEWKTGVSEDVKARLMGQADISWDEHENIYRVNIFRTPFFSAVNLLAEDIHTLSVTPCLAELKPQVRAALTLGIRGANIGDHIPFSLDIRFSDRIRIDPGSFADIRLKPSDIQKELFDTAFTPYDHVGITSESPIRITGHIVFYAPGQFTIPPVEIKYACSECSGDPVRTKETRAIPFKVSSIIPEGAENKLMIPVKDMTLENRLSSYRKESHICLAFSCLSFLVSLCCMIRFVINFRARKKREEASRMNKRGEQSAEHLRAFLNEDPAGPHWLYMADGGRIFRGYLLEIYQITPYQITPYQINGTAAVFFESVRKALPESIASDVCALLKRIDDAAALEMDVYPELEVFRTDMLQMLQIKS